jgi:hypothetical protein
MQGFIGEHIYKEHCIVIFEINISNIICKWKKKHVLIDTIIMNLFFFRIITINGTIINVNLIVM